MLNLEIMLEEIQSKAILFSRFWTHMCVLWCWVSSKQYFSVKYALIFHRSRTDIFFGGEFTSWCAFASVFKCILPFKCILVRLLINCVRWKLHI